MRKRLLFLLMAAVVLTGCADSNAKTEVILESEEEETSDYNLVMAERTDVTNSVTISISYSPTEIEEYSFSTQNAIIEFVYVEKGDTVRKGDVVATLENDDLEEKIESYEHSLEVKELELEQLKETLDFNIDREEYLYGYTTKTDEDREETDEAIEKLKKQYETSETSLNDQITILKLRLEEAKKEYEDSRIVSTVDGVISYCMAGLEGSMVEPGQTIIRAYDDSKCLFTSLDKAKAGYVTEGTEYTITIGKGTTLRECTVVPVRMDEWDSTMYFAPVNEDEKVSINEHGTITIVTDEALDVLAIPVDALHTSKDKYYVYYLDENAVRRMKWVTPGLIGNDYAEIKEGLNEGEYVIR